MESASPYMLYVVLHEEGKEVRILCSVSRDPVLSPYPNETHHVAGSRRRRTVVLALRNWLQSLSLSSFRHPPREVWHVSLYIFLSFRPSFTAIIARDGTLVIWRYEVHFT